MTLQSLVRRLGANASDNRKPSIYLDWNSTSPPHPDVIEAMESVARCAWANPASVHTWGRQSKHLVETVRDSLANCIGANRRDLAFTSGGTEANNWALHDAPGLVLSRLEHPSVTRQSDRLAGLGRPVRWVDVDQSGQLEPGAVANALTGMPLGTVVAAMAVNHETGIVQPLEAIADVARGFGAFVHVDAVQALGKLPMSTWNSWDSVALAAHKIRGPKGIGALAWRQNRQAPRPFILGGGQEQGLRSGTVDPVLVAGFGAALERLPAYFEAQGRLSDLRIQFESHLAGLVQSNVTNNVTRLGHIASLFVRGWLAEELVAALDLEGVFISSGSACAAGTAEVSPVITAMYDTIRARSSIRVSLGECTTKHEIEAAIEVFRRVLARP